MAGQRKRGFAAMNSQRQREIASKGGRAAHQKGTAHEFTPEEARAAGHRGGKAVSNDRQHMASIGRRGGQRSGEGTRGQKNRDEQFGSQENRHESRYEHALERNGHGTPRVTEFLRAEHNEVDELFYDYEAVGEHPSQREFLIRRICQALELHARLEEELFYPTIQARLAERGQQLVAEALTEHQMIKDLLGQLKGMRADDTSCYELMEQLKDKVHHHVAEEEQEMLPLVEEQLATELTQLGSQMQQRKQQLTEAVEFAPLPPDTVVRDW
jgi:general stress protein YciG